MVILSNQFLQGDALAILKTLPAESVQCCITSPPYWGLRDYDAEGQIGLEETPEQYVQKLVEVFREVRRVLKNDGVLWLNLGDSYATDTKGGGGKSSSKLAIKGRQNFQAFNAVKIQHGVKLKNLIGIPWRVAFALQADGWILRADVIWYKTNAMPEPVQDRPTKSHEYLFLLAKNRRYYYNAKAIREPHTARARKPGGFKPEKATGPNNRGGHSQWERRRTIEESYHISGRNRRSVWSIPTKSYPGAHFAVMPQRLVEPCVLSSSRPHDMILDPFSGAGTVALVATSYSRRYIGIELNPEYIRLAEERLGAVQLHLLEAS